jgi:hypothetical protein
MVDLNRNRNLNLNRTLTRALTLARFLIFFSSEPFSIFTCF